MRENILDTFPGVSKEDSIEILTNVTCWSAWEDNMSEGTVARKVLEEYKGKPDHQLFGMLMVGKLGAYHQATKKGLIHEAFQAKRDLEITEFAKLKKFIRRIVESQLNHEIFEYKTKPSSQNSN